MTREAELEVAEVEEGACEKWECREADDLEGGRGG